MQLPLLVLMFIWTIGLNICDAQDEPPPCGEYDTSQQDYVLLGCYEPFALDNSTLFINNLTTHECIYSCVNTSRSFAGIENTNTCRCADTIDIFENNSLQFIPGGVEADCLSSGKSVLYHSDYIVNVTGCGFTQLITHACVGLSTTCQCFQYCQNYTQFLIVEHPHNGIICGCTNDSINNITQPFIMTPQISETTCQLSLRICYSFIGCYTPFVDSGLVYTNNSMTINKCLEYCLYIGRQYAGLEHGNSCRCDNDTEIFSNHNLTYPSTPTCSIGAMLYYGDRFESGISCTDTQWNCSGIPIITNCSDHCYRFSQSPVVQPSDMGGEIICTCDNVDVGEDYEIIFSTEIENCTAMIMHIYDRTSLVIPDNSTFSSSDSLVRTTTISSTVETSSGTTESTPTTSSIGQVSTVVTSENPTTQQTLSTIETVQITSMSTPSQGSSNCDCPCTINLGTKWDFLKNLTLTREELEVYLDDELTELRNNLTIDAKETSAFKNTKISAPDNRPSSAAMGALGVVLMTVIFSLIILSDCITFFRHKSYNTRK